MKKKRLFESQELTGMMGRKFGFENKLLALELRHWLIEKLGPHIARDLERTELLDGYVELKVKSPMLAQELRMGETFFLEKFRELLQGRAEIHSLRILLSNRPPK